MKQLHDMYESTLKPILMEEFDLLVIFSLLSLHSQDKHVFISTGFDF